MTDADAKTIAEHLRDESVARHPSYNNADANALWHLREHVAQLADRVAKLEADRETPDD